MVAYRVAAGRQIRNLGGAHRLPVFRRLMSRGRIGVHSAAIERECLILGSNFGESWHDEKYAATTKGLKQRSGNCIVTFTPVVKSKKKKRLRSGAGLGAF